MYIPGWLLWMLFVVVIVGVAVRVGKAKADYDFVSPILGGAVLLIGMAVVLGFLFGRCGR